MHSSQVFRVVLASAWLWTITAVPSAGQGFVEGPTRAKVSSTAATVSPGTSAINGTWSYRSFVSDPDLATQPNNLLFGAGTLNLSVAATGQVSGTLGGTGWQLNLTGTATSGTPASVRFQGRGTIGGELWVYDYLGFVVPPWPNGVDQRPAIVGTIVRTVPHTNGTATAGVVAQWIAVKRDAPATALVGANAAVTSTSADAQLRALETKWAAAVGTNDPALIGQFFTADFIFVGAGGALQSRADHLKDFETGHLKVDSVTIQDFAIQVYDDFAVVNTLTHVEGHLGNQDLKGEYRFMDTWRLADGRWLAVARQQTRVRGAGPNPAAKLDGAAFQPAAENRSSRRGYLEKLRSRYLEEESPTKPAEKSAAPSKPGASTWRPAVPPEAAAATVASAGVTLTVDYSTVRIGNDDVRLRTYNGQPVGPPLRVKAGDTLHLQLINKLKPLPPSHAVNGHHEWNTTNLHFHGLHVKPQGTPQAESDNVLLELEPVNDPAGSSQSYAVQVPPDHVAGTFWYHAHKHGAVAAQVSSGMAGALIVERDDDVHNLDRVPQVATAGEEIMVLQQVAYLKPVAATQGDIEPRSDDDINDMFAPGSWRDLRRYVTVNGQRIPTLTLSPGQVRRLRLIYTGQRESVRLRIERLPGSTGSGPAGLSMHEIAVDGLPTGTIRQIAPPEVLEMFPGYRSDVLLQIPANTSGEYVLVDTRWDNNNVPRPDKGADGSQEPVRWIAKIRIAGPAVNMQLPSVADLAPHRLPDISPNVASTQYAFYGLAQTGGLSFLISRRDLSNSVSPVNAHDDKPFDDNPSAARVLTLGNSERWFVGSRNEGLNVIHPFHIHTNPFLVRRVLSLVEAGSTGTPVDVTAREIGAPVWRDTLAMKQGYTYELVSQYLHYAGSFVDHCHILDHEDNGMMELVQINSSSSPPAPTPPAQDNSLTAALTGNSTALAPANRPTVMFFVKGATCPHCLLQLTQQAAKLAQAGAEIIVISASNDAQEFPKLPVKVIVDPELKLFKEHGAYDGEAKHATIVRDRGGKILLRKIGDEPFNDLAAVQAALATAAPTALKERKDIEELIANNSPELETYKHAVELLMLNTDPNNNYQYFAKLHNDFTSACDHGCEHWNDLFLPFHRSLLHAYEKALQATDPPLTANVTVPYWKWTAQHSGQRYPSAFEQTGSVLCDKRVINRIGWFDFHSRRNRSSSSPMYSQNEIDDLWQLTTWRDFGGGPKSDPCFRNAGGDLEHPFHDQMHGTYIGGDMQNPTLAARDPIFWSFHAYIDLVWDRWQQLHPQDPSSMNANLRGLREKNTVAEVVHTADLGYFYGGTVVPPNLLAAAVAAQPPASFRTTPLVLETATSAAQVVQWGGLGPFTFAATIPDANFQTAHLKLDRVRTPIRFSYDIEVFVHPASVPAQVQDPAFRQAYRYPLNFALWQGHDHGSGQVEFRDAYLRVTPLLSKLAQTAAGEKWRITLAPVSPKGIAADAEPYRSQIQFAGLELVLDRAAEKPRPASDVQHEPAR